MILHSYSHVQNISFSNCKIEISRRKFKLNPETRFQLKFLGLRKSGLSHRTLSGMYGLLRSNKSLNVCFEKILAAKSDKPQVEKSLRTKLSNNLKNRESLEFLKLCEENSKQKKLVLEDLLRLPKKLMVK